MSNAEEITTAEAPFDDHNCDYILQSTNGVNFHVYKLVISLISPVFQDKFTLPQGESQSDGSFVPIMTVAEGSTTLRSLLLLCYPTVTPTFVSLDDAKAVLETAKQYDMQAALNCAGDFIIAQSCQITFSTYTLFPVDSDGTIINSNVNYCYVFKNDAKCCDVIQK